VCFPGQADLADFLGFASAVSAAAGAATFVVAAVIRLAQVAGWLPGQPPTYGR